MVEEITRYPHESPILVGMLMVVIGLMICIWRIQNPWIPDCPIDPAYVQLTTTKVMLICDDMDFIPILACGLAIMGISFIFTDIMGEPE